ncbi:hypothetical protein [Sphingobium chungangianum]
MRFLILAAAALSLATPALAETAATAKYTSADTELGVLLDNPAAKAIVEKYIPGMTSNDQVDMARAMTLKAIQQYAPDDVTDARLAAIDADLAKLP